MAGLWLSQDRFRPLVLGRTKDPSKPTTMREHQQVKHKELNGKKSCAKDGTGLESEGWMHKPEITVGEWGQGAVTIRKGQKNCQEQAWEVG